MVCAFFPAANYPPAIFYWIWHFEGLSAGPSLFLSVIGFSPIILGLAFSKRCCQLFILCRSHQPLSPFAFILVQSVSRGWQKSNCKHTSSAQQLSKGAEWERNWSAGSQYSKQSLAVPCVLSNYEVLEVAGSFAWAKKRLKTAKKVFVKKHFTISFIDMPRIYLMTFFFCLHLIILTSLMFTYNVT